MDNHSGGWAGLCLVVSIFMVGILALGCFVGMMIKDPRIVYRPIIQSGDVVINEITYTRHNTKIDTTYNQEYNGDWYEVMRLRSDLKRKVVE